VVRVVKASMRGLLAIVVASAAACAHTQQLPPPQPAISKQFSPGQVWRYRTRPGEEGSRVIIGKVERASELGTIVHVKLIGLALQTPAGSGSVVEHAPVAEAQMALSVTELTHEPPDLEGFAEGYETWLSEFRAGRAGVFTLTLSEIAEHVERALNP
jgi:hypothetical protein